MTAKVCVIGADAMEPALILRWIESGDLPNLARLRARAVWGPVVGPPRFFSGASWPSFYTGVSPARHGQYLHTLYDPATCIHRPFRPASTRVPPFWSRPEWRAKKTAIINMPYAQLEERVTGMQVVNWGVHDHNDDPIETSPAELAPDILSRFGADPVGDCAATERTTAGYLALQEHLLQRLRQKRKMFSHYLWSEAWDLFVAVVDECHCAGHQLWHFHEPSHGRHDPGAPAALREAIRNVYVEIDHILGDVLDRLPADSTLLFVSSHGMGPAFDANAVFEEILRRLDGLPPRPPNYGEARSIQLAALRGLRDRLPPILQRALEPVRKRYGRGHLIDQLEAERRSRRSFWFPTHDLWGGIRINLVGREASGIVQPGGECEAYVEQLTADLHQLRDGRSGAPIVAEVVRSTEMDLAGHDGEHPDLIVRWAKASLSWIESPKVGRLDSRAVVERGGDHVPSMRGVFFASGPQIAPRPLIGAVRLEDFPVTISGLFGIALADTEGSAIAAVRAPSSVTSAVE